MEPGSALEWQALVQVLYTGALYTAIAHSWWSLNKRGSVASSWGGMVITMTVYATEALGNSVHTTLQSEHTRENGGNTTL